VQTVLGLIPELAVETLDTGCCGMAGAFGYAAENFAVSRAVAADSLLPALQSADADTLLVADGTSCRSQIRDLTRYDAVHVAQVLARALPGAPAA